MSPGSPGCSVGNQFAFRFGRGLPAPYDLRRLFASRLELTRNRRASRRMLRSCWDWFFLSPFCVPVCKLCVRSPGSRREVAPETGNSSLQQIVFEAMQVWREWLIASVVEIDESHALFVFVQDNQTRELTVIDTIECCLDATHHQEIEEPLFLLDQGSTEIAALGIGFDAFSFRCRFSVAGPAERTGLRQGVGAVVPVIAAVCRHFAPANSHAGLANPFAVTTGQRLIGFPGAGRPLFNPVVIIEDLNVVNVVLAAPGQAFFDGAKLARNLTRTVDFALGDRT